MRNSSRRSTLWCGRSCPGEAGVAGRVCGPAGFCSTSLRARCQIADLAVKREPDNEHDANAVAITAGRPATKIGYVNKQRAKWVAELLDGGQELDGLVIQSKTSSPRILLTTPEMLAYLRR
ncbi:HIRAN domain-containing protein [Pseudarthrobacter sp. J75]|uniref:HIRAN domain-containing protein n=1 Tax=unclassified Pseudarthrobacter TaxID=2647000 RepID=UPI002E80FB63|nr:MULTISPECIES: HIRAN domain-containing protein [unclassified Pseudarthrobacter]MEE2522512.1 HIRAN domain-containing protein [Pseudarthrobacter sp. J47]MEE2529144.1 HIRAN domain-containing protein [Pseudarthrobacter sp. J75]